MDNQRCLVLQYKNRPNHMYVHTYICIYILYPFLCRYRYKICNKGEKHKAKTEIRLIIRLNCSLNVDIWTINGVLLSSIKRDLIIVIKDIYVCIYICMFMYMYVFLYINVHIYISLIC
jgi:hypothetical protein